MIHITMSRENYKNIPFKMITISGQRKSNLLIDNKLLDEDSFITVLSKLRWN